MTVQQRRVLRFSDIEIVIDAPPDADGLVRRAESRGDAEDAYWAHLWPAALALADYAARSTLIRPGTRVLEIGCGLGLVGLVVARRGGQVTLTDREEEAVRAAEHQAAINGLAACCTRYDWNDPPDAAWRPDLLLGADVLYRESAHAPIARLIELLGCMAVLAVPNRPGSGNAAELFRRRGLRVWEGPMQGGRLLLAQSA